MSCIWQVYLHLGQLADHFDLLLQDPPQGLLGCGFVVVFVLLERKQLLLNPLLRLGLQKRRQEEEEAEEKAIR